ncbi:hypothetical protein [Corynebacterium epidermidicanis]|nr:hypothetical protein [Corynebacterium epidermidicanis]
MFQTQVSTLRGGPWHLLIPVGCIGVVVANLSWSVESQPASAPVLPVVSVPTPTVVDDRIDVAYDSFINNPTGSQLSFTRLSDGHHVGSATERYPRPALSLIKLYIADYVLVHGTEAEKEQALEMIRGSSDGYAEELFAAYPDSIEAVARDYGLWSTRSSEEGWGYSVTSMYDVVKFVRAKLEHDPKSPLLQAMKEAHDTAEDGYAQNFGTAVLPGVVGTKWGWSNDYVVHSSVSFGDDYVVAAAVLGSAEDLTSLVERRVRPLLAGQ